MKACNSCGWSSGLIYVWDKEFLEERNFLCGSRWLCIEGRLKSWNFEGAFLVIYGMHSRRERMDLWVVLLNIEDMVTSPLLVIRDFNEVLKPEKLSNATSITRSMKDFAEWILQMHLIDLSIIGRMFTWARGTSFNRIERVLIEPKWFKEFKELKLWV